MKDRPRREQQGAGWGKSGACDRTHRPGPARSRCVRDTRGLAPRRDGPISVSRCAGFPGIRRATTPCQTEPTARRPCRVKGRCVPPPMRREDDVNRVGSGLCRASTVHDGCSSRACRGGGALGRAGNIGRRSGPRRWVEGWCGVRRIRRNVLIPTALVGRGDSCASTVAPSRGPWRDRGQGVPDLLGSGPPSRAVYSRSGVGGAAVSR